jgi:hypothetical protein
MTTVQDLLDNVKKLDVPFESTEAINDTAGQYINLQKEQMFAGINEEGFPIQPPYAARTVAIKKKKGQPTDRVTLKDTGDFYSDMFLDVRDNDFVIDSADSKTDELLKKYGEEIFGLTEKNQDQYVEENLEPVFQERIQKALEL